MIKPEEELPLYIIVYIIVLNAKPSGNAGFFFAGQNKTEQLSPQPLATTVNNLVKKHKAYKIYR